MGGLDGNSFVDIAVGSWFHGTRYIGALKTFKVNVCPGPGVRSYFRTCLSRWGGKDGAKKYED